MLNTSKGPAVRGPRAQADKYAYAAEVQRLVAELPGVGVIAGAVQDVVVERGRVTGVVVGTGVDTGVGAETDAVTVAAASRGRPARLRAKAVVLTTGTFMRGLMHTGERATPGGRVGEAPSVGISAALERLGFELGRLKTGTPPRLDRDTIDWDDLEGQRGDDEPVPFSDLSPGVLPGGRFPAIEQVECRLTRTTAAIHDAIRANLHRSPMHNGAITAETGPRYCPSIEDKVVRFADRDGHHVFLEPESLRTNEVYCNGISTSLPQDVQEQIVHGMPGCARARILRWGYAVEYDMVWPHQIDATGMTKLVDGLFLAGQINCTTGYEEAGGQGVVAGLNAARYALDLSLVRLGRDQAFIGVMLDDLVTKVPREPLVDDRRWQAWETRQAALADVYASLARMREGNKSLLEIARRPDVTVDDLAARLDRRFERALVERVVTEARYAGYIARQRAEIKRQNGADARAVPDWLDPHAISGLRAEAAEVLARFRPATFGQATRLPGVNPADITLLAVAVARGPSRTGIVG
jgi:tRNA uridine 5-carboxymethylaminomethyl modification enzyme